ncbi:LLM class oxidoreductase [Nonomuraea sp. SBT364]|uniref:LLM class oxidoreductase n=1 Tax=Nonomuraea sp. SBT364 TaxID=1580530 RepID=UPI00066DF2F7|nr:LLM class oxidoreductase [Nonomuraea sp. SBT364]
MSDRTAHVGFDRMFAHGRLTVGLFLPLWPYTGDMAALRGQSALVQEAERAGFAAVWVRDIPLADTSFGDVGQVYDPWSALTWLAAHTSRITLATGSVIFSLRHPIDLAKQAASIDHLSGGRLVLGAASGDRPSEFPAYGVDFDGRGRRYRDAVDSFRDLLRPSASGVELLPKPVHGHIPLLVTGSSQQPLEWIAEHADGWLIYPGATATADGPIALGKKAAAWRGLIPSGAFKPVATNEWIDLAEDPLHPPTPLRGGFVLRTGTQGLLELLGRWQDAGVNHGALGVQHGRRPAGEVIAQLGEEVLPHFPALGTAAPQAAAW